jgi:hypothetical protein
VLPSRKLLRLDPSAVVRRSSELAVHRPSSSYDAARQIDCTAVHFSVSGQLSVNENSEVVDLIAALRPPGYQVLTDRDALRLFKTGVGIYCAMLTESRREESTNFA